MWSYEEYVYIKKKKASKIEWGSQFQQKNEKIVSKFKFSIKIYEKW